MTFRILSLDGGGIRGVVSATILKEVEAVIKEKEGKALHEYFDLIAGTSTGSILAAGIACQKNAEEMVQLYKNEGKNIFIESVRWRRKWRWLSRFLGSKVLYPHEFRKQGLANVLKRTLTEPGSGKAATIADIKQTQLLILAYDVLSRNTTWFANDDPTEWWYENKIKLWEICCASASAPTFFRPYELFYNREDQMYLPHIDGGVAANNPELAAIAHALLMKIDNNPKIDKKPKIKDIAVLSIGTGKTTSSYTYEEVKKWGLFAWATKIPDIFIDPGAENTEHIARRMFLSIEWKNYLRLDFDINENSKSDEPCRNKYTGKKISEEIDDPNLCENLIEAAKGYLKSGEVEYSQPIKKNGEIQYKDGEIQYKEERAKIPVSSAICQFIESNPVKDSSCS